MRAGIDHEAADTAPTGTAVDGPGRPDRPGTSPSATGGPPYRLTGLPPSQRPAAVAVALLLVLPIVISGVRAVADGWLPSGDEALIGIKSLDVFSRHPPLTGQPSTTGQFVRTFHPGPIEFWSFAVPVRVFGLRIGMLVGAGAVNAAGVAVAAWVLFRRGGPGVGLAGSILLAAAMWSQGTALLTDTISSSMGGLPFLAVAVLAWAVAAGDHRLLPLAVVVACWTAQQHLSVVLPVAVASMWALGALAWRTWRARQRSGVPARPVLLWLAAGLAVGLVLWAPVLVEEVTGDPGNLTAVARFSQHDGRPTLGPLSGARQAARAVGVPPMFTRTTVVGSDLWAPIGPLAAATAALVVGALLAVGLSFRRRAPELSMMAFTALVIAAGGAWNGSNVLATIERNRIAFYRWSWAVAILTWTALGWAAGRLLAERRAERAGDLDRPVPARSVNPTVRRLSVPLVVVVLAAFAVHSAVADGPDDERRDAVAFDLERAVISAVDREITDDGPYLLISKGSLAALSVGPALAAHLVEQGVDLQVTPWAATGYGRHRRYRPGTVQGVIVVFSGKGSIEAPPGRRLFLGGLDRKTERKHELAEQIRSSEIVVSEDGDTLLARLRDDEKLLVEAMTETPEGHVGLLDFDAGIDLLLAGYLVEPKLDRAKLRQLRDDDAKPVRVWSENRAGVWLLTPAQLEQWGPAAGKL
jgi:hypothetical protein